MDDHLRYVYQRIENEIRRGELSEREISDLFHKYVIEGVEHLRALPLYSGASDAAEEQLIQEYDFDLEEFLQSEFGEIPGFENVKALLYESAVLATSRCQERPNDTTLAFIGFGSEEHLSNLIRTECRGRYGGIPRMRIDPPFGASTDPHSGSISTFAQAEAIMGFVKGVQPDVFGLFFDHWMDGVEGLYKDREEGRRVANELADEMNERITKDLNARFIDPMLDTVGSLSLRDSADLAAALVGIQAMRANASPQPPGVGGLVESLIIDRADGVRWIQRLPR